MQQAAHLRAFISYSRANKEFADRLALSLEKENIEPIIDRKDLPQLEDWERELAGLILSSDAAIIVLSTASLKSKVVSWEIDQAIRHAKRMAPIVLEEIDVSEVPPELARINFIFFDDPTKYEE